MVPGEERLFYETLGRRVDARGQSLGRSVGWLADDVAGSGEAQFVQYGHDDGAGVQPAVVEMEGDGFVWQGSFALQPVDDLGSGDDLPSVF